MPVALSTYNDLVTECQDWLFGRVDIAAKVPTFVRLAEAKFNRTLSCRQMEQRSTTIISLANDEPEFVSLPGDFQLMRRVRLKNAPGRPRLKFAVASQLDDLSQRENSGQPGTPIWFGLAGDEMELCPAPNSEFVIEMTYRKKLPPLGADNQTNWLLDLAPDAYLYGTLMEAAPYLHEDERISVWSSGVQGAVDQLNAMSEKALYNAGPLVIRRKGYR